MLSLGGQGQFFDDPILIVASLTSGTNGFFDPDLPVVVTSFQVTVPVAVGLVTLVVVTTVWGEPVIGPSLAGECTTAGTGGTWSFNHWPLGDVWYSLGSLCCSE